MLEPSVLPRVQQHPNLLAWLAGENAREYRGATRAGVVLFMPSVFNRPDAVHPQSFMRVGARRLAVEVRTVGAGLNPSSHSSDRSMAAETLRMIETTRKQWGVN